MEPVKPPAGPDAGWPPEARASTHRMGRFVLVKELGRGAMGTVYKAWDPPLGRWVAIKVLQHVAADAEGLERFRREAAVVASLDHPTIAPVHDVMDIEGRYAIVMKFIDGRTLEEIFRDFPGGTSSIELVVRLIRDAALGLGYAHARGFVHRDLKPGNLMVDREGKLYVLDFGLAKVLARSGAMTDLGRMMGTPAYMSPEQAMGLARDVDPRSDVFSLGSTLWALLAGRRPFQGKGDMDVARAILRDPTPSIRARRPGVREELDLVLRKAMHREREGRYPTGAELAAALNECLLHEETARESGRKSEPIRGEQARGVVLMIEDESAMVAFVQAALVRDPLDVVHYVDGMAALDAAAALAPAVVLLDVNLPGLSGWEILERLRKIPSYETTPIIMVTGEGTDEDIVRGFQLGADDYIVKPFSPTVFRARVRRQLLRRDARGETATSSPPAPPA